jgi:hypothetical protein
MYVTIAAFHVRGIKLTLVFELGKSENNILKKEEEQENCCPSITGFRGYDNL